jgi:hypothetical protein
MVVLLVAIDMSRAKVVSLPDGKSWQLSSIPFLVVNISSDLLFFILYISR